MDVREEQAAKQYSPKLVTEDGITVPAHPQIIVLLSVSITALQFSRESYTEFPASTTMDVREEQLPKQPSPKLVTEDGILMDVREEHSEYLQLTVYQFVLFKMVEKLFRGFY